MGRQMQPAARSRTRDDVARADRRWFLLVILVFLASVGALLVMRMIYRATGPHPEVRYLIRRLRFHANSLFRRRLSRPSP